VPLARRHRIRLRQRRQCRVRQRLLDRAPLAAAHQRGREPCGAGRRDITRVVTDHEGGRRLDAAGAHRIEQQSRCRLAALTAGIRRVQAAEDRIDRATSRRRAVRHARMHARQVGGRHQPAAHSGLVRGDRDAYAGRAQPRQRPE